MSLLMGVCGLGFAKPLNHIVVFGDSLSDNGNLYAYTHHQVPPSPPYFEGRFSNGPVWVEYLTRVYFPTQEMENYLSDYAFGGAGVAESLMNGSPLLTLKKEVDTYLLANHDKADPNRLYLLWIGANNYLGVPSAADDVPNQVNTGISEQLKRLVKAGAKHILIMNLPDLGKLPMARMLGVEKQLTQFASQHNALLSEKIKHLQETYTGVQWLYFNVNQMLEELMTAPTSYGFTNIKEPCYKTNGLLQSLPADSLKMVAEVQTEPMSCDGYLFFDAIHPTGLAHQIMANRMQAFLEDAGIELKAGLLR
ncbi:MAG: SGNH/GDSL hydrolase family protein [Legionella sp.]|nr:SGNH/GDSL hydrolase family protein [Legionella sp.]